MPRFRRQPLLEKPISVKVTAEEEQSLKDAAQAGACAMTDILREGLDLYFLARELLPEGSDLYEGVKAALEAAAPKGKKR